MKVPQPILDGRVIPVALGLDGSTAPNMIAALEAGGIAVIEITVEGRGGLDAIAAVSLAAGAVAVGVGGWLTSHDDLDEVTKRAELLAHLTTSGDAR